MDMENKFKESRFIEQIMVMGENQKFPSALIIPNFNYANEWLKAKGIITANLSNKELINKKELKDKIQSEVDSFNKEYGNWEKIKK